MKNPESHTQLTGMWYYVFVRKKEEGIKMTNFKNNLWYVWGAGWDANWNDVATWEPYAVCETEDDAKVACRRLWAEELDSDEQVFIFHDGIIGDEPEMFGWEYYMSY